MAPTGQASGSLTSPITNLGVPIAPGAGIPGTQYAAPIQGDSSSSTTGGYSVTTGWYITIAIAVSLALANTPLGPFLVGILGVALLYQIGQLVQGK